MATIKLRNRPNHFPSLASTRFSLAFFDSLAPAFIVLLVEAEGAGVMATKDAVMVPLATFITDAGI